MAIGRIAKGTASGTNSTGVGITLASALSISAGSTLVVMLRYDNTTAGTSVLPDGMAWNGHALAVPSGGGNGRGQTWLLQNATAGTGDLILDDSSAGILDSWEAIITEVTGCATESLDKGKSATGSGTTPSSGASATTTQANELLIGCVGWGTGAISGSWSNSFSAGQSCALGSNSLEEGYRIVSATGAYTLAKSGCTSALWGATLVTLKASTVAPTSVTLTSMRVTHTVINYAMIVPSTALKIGVSAAAALPQPGRKTALALTSMSGAAALEQAGRADATAIGMAASATMPQAARESRWVFPDAAIVQPLTTLTAPQVSQSASIGVRTNGDPYIAAWMDSPTPTWKIVGGGEIAMLVVAAIYAAPTMRSAPDEPHWIASFHEIGGAELYAIGVTPDLRLCGWTRHRGIIMSAPGVVAADGSAHQYELSMVYGRELSIDGVSVAWDLIYLLDGSNDGLFSEGHLPCRVMAFNGIAGTTRCPMAIMRVEFVNENNPLVWNFSEGNGSQVAGSEVGDPDIPGVDWTLRFGWYDPRPAFQLPDGYGVPPTGGLSLAYRWLIQTKYRKATVIRPNYRPTTSGPSGGYKNSEGAQST